jgi:hypothetical protein
MVSLHTGIEPYHRYIVSQQTGTKPRKDNKATEHTMSGPPNHDQSPDLTHRGLQKNVSKM